MAEPADALLVLASASPRRHALLSAAGVRFEVRPADVDESAHPGETPQDQVQRLARAKVLAVLQTLPAEPPRWVLAADTLVSIDGDTLGKPRDADHARELLGRLVGRTHRVLTGVALASSAGGALRSFLGESEVTLREADASEIRAYVATGEPLDKAGAYAFQGEGRRFVTGLRGSETNVIGLPLAETLALLQDAGVAA